MPAMTRIAVMRFLGSAEILQCRKTVSDAQLLADMQRGHLPSTHDGTEAVEETHL
jgi:hypothetical protein